MTTSEKPEKTEQTVKQVVEDMHRYFRDNGYFKPDDLHRVFGDPGNVVEVQVSTEFSMSSLRKISI